MTFLGDKMKKTKKMKNCLLGVFALLGVVALAPQLSFAGGTKVSYDEGWEEGRNFVNCYQCYEYTDSLAVRDARETCDTKYRQGNWTEIYWDIIAYGRECYRSGWRGWNCETEVIVRCSIHSY